MGKIGLVAGEGQLPMEFLRSARAKGEKVVVFAIKGMADASIEKEAEKVYWIEVREYAKSVFIVVKEGVKHLVFLGKIKKSAIYDDKVDSEGKHALKGLHDKKDTSFFKEGERRLKLLGIDVLSAGEYLSQLLPEKGVISRKMPDERISADIEFGFETAKKMAGMDIGQTVIIKEKTVVAVEAMEGTDATIARAREIAGDGCVMVKVARPVQDMKWDVPTVGPDTMTKLMENGFSAIAIESGKMYLVEKERFLKMADAAGIVVKVI